MCMYVCACVCVDIFMIERLQRRKGIHLMRILPTLNYESTRYARLKIEWPIKERKCTVIEEVQVRFPGPRAMSDYRIR